MPLASADSPASPLAPREAYRLWADTYDVENPVTTLERRCVRELTPPLEGVALLDAACGTGRRLPRVGGRGPHRVAGIDLSHQMIHRARRDTSPLASGSSRARAALRCTLAVADVCALPFDDRTFDVIWFRLAAGHLRELGVAYAEFARVARPGACVVVTDFHPAAASAGHTRSFRDARGDLHVVEHHVHEVSAHVDTALRAGLTFDRAVEPAVGRAVRGFYVAAGRLAAYDLQRGLPLVLALAFHA